MTQQSDTKFSRGTAAITLFATLVAVEYASGNYDVWDFSIASVVLYVVIKNWRFILEDEISHMTSCVSVGVSVAILSAVILTAFDCTNFLQWPHPQLELTFLISAVVSSATYLFTKNQVVNNA